MVIRITSLTKKYLPACYKYVQRQAVSAKQEVQGGAAYYRYNLKAGWQVGKRLAHSQNQNVLRAAWTKIYASLVKSKVRQKDIPALLGGVGLIVPVPAGSVAGYFLGKIINKVISKFR